MTAPPTPPLLPEEMLTPGEVADLFRVDVKTVSRWDKAGRFPEGTVIRTPGGHRRFRASGIAPFLNGGQR